MSESLQFFVDHHFHGGLRHRRRTPCGMVLFGELVKREVAVHARMAFASNAEQSLRVQHSSAATTLAACERMSTPDRSRHRGRYSATRRASAGLTVKLPVGREVARAVHQMRQQHTRNSVGGHDPEPRSRRSRVESFARLPAAFEHVGNVAYPLDEIHARGVGSIPLEVLTSKDP